jgi:hypothetical protein
LISVSFSHASQHPSVLAELSLCRFERRRVAIHAHVRWHRDARPMALPALDNSSRYPQVIYDWFIDVGVQSARTEPISSRKS